MRYLPVIALILLTLASSASARILNFPDDFQTIQAAIDSTQDGDTVLVQPGRYVENIDFDGHNIVVGSLYLTTGDTTYVERTVIDGDSTNSVVQIGSGENAHTVITGFTIQRGYGLPGGGFFIRASSPVLDHLIICRNYLAGIYIDRDSNPRIIHCQIVDNIGQNGGGIQIMDGCSATIENSVISDNYAGGGGGLCLWRGASLSMTNCIVDNNFARFSDGGGIYATENCTLNLNNVTITNNNATDDCYGGGIFCESGTSLQMSNSHIAGNSGWWGGGLAFRDECSASISHTTIIADTSINPGGGILIDWDCDVTLDHVVIADNTAPDGAAIGIGDEMTAGRLQLTNTTIVRNHSAHRGSVYIDLGLVCTIRNGIIRDNTPGNIYVSRTGPENQLTIDHTNLQGGRDSIEDNHNVAITWGDGNIDSDPLFANAQHGDYHLTEHSPCIDAGDPNSPPDPDGTRADMGAFYYEQNVPRPVIYVEPDTLNFGTIGVGDIAFDTLTIHNFGGEPLSVSELVIPDQAAFLFESNSDPFDLQTGESHTVVIGFHPTEEDNFQTVLRISSNDPAHGVVEVPIIGRAILMVPHIVVEPDTMRFGYVPHGEAFEQHLLLRNSGNRVLNIVSLTVDPWQSPFRIVQGVEVDQIVPDSSWTMTVRFSPVNSLDYEAQIQIECDDPDRRMVEVALLGSALSVDNGGRSLPVEYGLAASYPNPFNSSATIRFGLDKSATTRLAVYGLDGRLVEELANGRLEAGEHSVVWNAGGLPGGVYLVRLESGGRQAVSKVVLMK